MNNVVRLSLLKVLDVPGAVEPILNGGPFPRIWQVHVNSLWGRERYRWQTEPV